MVRIISLIWILIALIIGAIFFLFGLNTPIVENEFVIEEPIDRPEEDIVELALANEDLSTLVTAVRAAGLVETLQGEGPFTVFAPTNEAFEQLPEGVLESLLEDTEALTDILLYHAVIMELDAEDVVQKTEIMMVNGETVEVSIVGDRVFINQAEILITDVFASNGVIHVIDAVLIPSNG